MSRRLYVSRRGRLVCRVGRVLALGGGGDLGHLGQLGDTRILIESSNSELETRHTELLKFMIIFPRNLGQILG